MGQISGQGIKAIFTNTAPTTGRRNIIDCAGDFNAGKIIKEDKTQRI